jgi:hypothetical protein
MCHPVFSTKEFVQEFIFYSGVQELQEEAAVAAPRREKSESPFCNS